MKREYDYYLLSWASQTGGDLRPIKDVDGKQARVKARSHDEALKKGAIRYRGTGVLIGAVKIG
jgi:hypothetical protein